MLAGVTFEIRPGEKVSLVGPNGAGKTTTLRCILGLLEPTSGDVMVDGFRVSQQPTEIRRRVGLVSASAGLLFNQLKYNARAPAPTRIPKPAPIFSPRQLWTSLPDALDRPLSSHCASRGD